MNHLETEQDRKDRWYAKHIAPEYVEVRSATLDEMTKSSGIIDKPGGSEESLPAVPGVPSSLLQRSEARQYLRTHLQQYGFAVVRHVMKDSECNHALSLAWDYLEAASAAEKKFQEHGGTCKVGQNKNDGALWPKDPVRRNEVKTYKSEFYPRSVEGNIFAFYGSGHSSFMWYLRSREMVQETFAAIHNVNTDDLMTSMDGFVLWTESDRQKDRGWFHIDQSPTMKPEFCSIQGLVNLLPVTEKTGGNVVVVGSHSMFPEHYLQRKNLLFYEDRLKEIGTDDWLEIDPNDGMLETKRVISCLLAPGDLLIWDSRTVHCSYREDFEESSASVFDSQFGLIRAAGLVNMIPRVDCSKEFEMERKEAISNSRTLTHWATKVSPLGNERDDDVQKEGRCVRYLKQQRRNILLSFDDLTDSQRNLV